jgi:bifunctional ADP-heptose synthase (sugar kinase/adenylyltransferase)
VAHNLEALGADFLFAFIAGPDFLKKSADIFHGRKISKNIFTEPGRVVTTKERFLIDGRKVLRWNIEDNRPISKNAERQVLSWIEKHLKLFDVLVISDSRHGFISRRLARTFIALANRHNIPIWVDSQIADSRGNHAWYGGASLILLNEKEALDVDPAFTPKNACASLERISKILGIRDIVVKLGANGSVALVGGRFIKTPGRRVKAVDAVGAGDAFLAALALTGEVSEESLEFANHWAALATTILGTEPPTLAMMKGRRKSSGK